MRHQESWKECLAAHKIAVGYSHGAWLAEEADTKAIPHQQLPVASKSSRELWADPAPLFGFPKL